MSSSEEAVGGGCMEVELRELSSAMESLSLSLLAEERAQREKCAMERYINFAGRVKLSAIMKRLVARF